MMKNYTKKNPFAVALGRIKTPKKAKSSRENGKLGGRPRKDWTIKPSGSKMVRGKTKVEKLTK